MIQQLVLDAGAFISGATFYSLGQHVQYITTPAVLAELRDSRTSDFLKRFPYEIITKIPSNHATATVCDFARACGEFSSLSTADIEILALVYQLESETHGLDNLILSTASDGLVVPHIRKKNLEGHYPIDIKVGNLDISAFYDDKRYASRPQPWKTLERREQKVDENEGNVEGKEVSADDEEGSWITPLNFEEVKAKTTTGNHDFDNTSTSTVACITTDYAMQNVMHQMGLRLVTVDGKHLGKIQSYVKGCNACKQLIHDMSREFCDKCGSHSLSKVLFRYGRNGKPQYKWIKTRALNSRRGNIYSIPKMKGGRHKNIILSEDELLKERKRAGFLKNQGKKKEDLFADAILFGSTNAKAYRVKPDYGYGGRNPNEVRRKSKSRRKKH